MTKISEQDYDYNSLKNTFKNVSDAVDKNLQEAGININRSEGFFSSIGNWFKDLFSGSKDLGILENTNDTVLGDDVKVDATDKDAIKNIISDNGFWEKIKNWFSGLFNSSSDKTEEDSSNNSNSDSKNSNTDINSENTSQTENNTNASENNTSEHSEKEKASENISTNNQN